MPRTKKLNKLFIIGAGGFGREVLQWAADVPPTQRDWEVAGFLDPNGRSVAPRCPVVGTEETLELEDSHRFICAIGEPERKFAICEKLAARGGIFISIVHPAAIVASTSEIGMGCIVCPGAVVTANARLRDFVTLNLCATVGHDADIGEGCTVSPHASVSGWCSVGKRVAIGSGAVIVPGVTVDDDVVVGAGSVVVRRAYRYSTVFGIPATEVFTRKR